MPRTGWALAQAPFFWVSRKGSSSVLVVPFHQPLQRPHREAVAQPMRVDLRETRFEPGSDTGTGAGEHAGPGRERASACPGRQQAGAPAGSNQAAALTRGQRVPRHRTPAESRHHVKAETIATWVVSVWQKRQLGEYAPSWDPGGVHSPNSLFAASFAQAGFAMEIPSPELFYELLPPHYVRIDARRGVKIRGLWYDDEKVLRDYRGQRSTRGGKHKGHWVIRRDPRDRRAVFFQDPITHAWHPLAWTGLPAVGQMPAFGDARVRDLLKKAEASGIKPKSDTELLPVLLELIGSKIPVSQWPAQLSKSQR